MFDKLQTVEEYIDNIEQAHQNIANTCNLYSNNLILINGNTPFYINVMCKYLKKQGLSFIIPSFQDISNHGSLGDFLRFQSSQNTTNILILDIVGELQHIFETISETVDAINVNRDLFTNKFKSTIIIAPPKLTYAIRRHARDFWSCVNLFVDTTKWFCSPLMLPIANIKINANPTTHLIDIYKNNRDEYNKFIDLYEKIKKNLKKYDHQTFCKYYQAINDFSISSKIKLIQILFETLSTSQASYNMYKTKINDIKSLFDNKIINVETSLGLAEYFFKCGEYELSKSCYQQVYQHLMNTWMNESTDFVLTFISCNIITCKYMQQGLHQPKEFESELSYRFKLIDNKLCNLQKEFISDYLFLVHSNICHHNHAQHKDILERLEKIKIHSLNEVSFSCTINTLSAWENFISNDFNPITFDLEDPILSEIYSSLQHMISSFCNGNFQHARTSYKVVRKKARIYGYLQILKFAEDFNHNMLWLYSETEKH